MCEFSKETLRIGDRMSDYLNNASGVTVSCNSTKRSLPQSHPLLIIRIILSFVFISPLSIGSINALSITSPQPECNERVTFALFLDVLEFCFLLRAASFTILLEVTPLANRDDCCLESEHTKPRAHVSTLLKARYTHKAGGIKNLL